MKTLEDSLFEQEKATALTQDCTQGICECCEGSMYYKSSFDKAIDAIMVKLNCSQEDAVDYYDGVSNDY